MEIVGSSVVPHIEDLSNLGAYRFISETGRELGLSKEADFEHYEEYFYWYAERSKGRIGEHATVPTIQHQVGRWRAMLKYCYEVELSDLVVGKLRKVSFLSLSRS